MWAQHLFGQNKHKRNSRLPLNQSDKRSHAISLREGKNIHAAVFTVVDPQRFLIEMKWLLSRINDRGDWFGICFVRLHHSFVFFVYWLVLIDCLSLVWSRIVICDLIYSCDNKCFVIAAVFILLKVGEQHRRYLHERASDRLHRDLVTLTLIQVTIISCILQY